MIKFVGIQSALHWEDVEENLAAFTEKIENIKEDVDVIVLPEMFTTGFSMNPSPLAETMDSRSMEWMANQAALTKAVITGSLIIKSEAKFYNRLIWMQPDGNYSFYDKRHLFSLSGEHLHYSAGAEKKIVEYKSWRINLNICYDLRFPVWTRNLDDYDVLLNVANWPQKRSAHWEALIRARAIENLSYVVAVNRFGKDGNGNYHSGHSTMLNPMGEIITTSVDQEEIIYGAFSKKELKNHRERYNFLNDRDKFRIQL